MESVGIVVIAAIAIVLVVALAVRLRRTPIVGEGELGPVRQDATPVESDVDDRLHVALGTAPDANLLGSDSGEPGRGIHITKTVVTRRIGLRVEPDRIAITVDGQPYDSLEQIPDEALRADVRKRLASLPAEIDDPVARVKVENSLRRVGIEPAAE